MDPTELGAAVCGLRDTVTTFLVPLPLHERSRARGPERGVPPGMSSGSCRSTESSPSRTNDDGASLRASFPPKLSALASRVTPDQGQDGAPGFDRLALSCSGSEFHVGSESRRAISASVPRSPGPPSLSCAPSGSSSQKSCPHGWASIPRGASSPGALKCPWPPERASASEALQKQPSPPDPSTQSLRPPLAPPEDCASSLQPGRWWKGRSGRAPGNGLHGGTKPHTVWMARLVQALDSTEEERN